MSGSFPLVRCKRWLLLGPILALCALGSAVTQARELKIGGTGNALGTMTLVAQAYMTANPTASVTVLPSIGSSGAIKAVPNGAIDMGLSARPLKASEAQSGIVAVEYARSLSVFAVAKSSNIESITTNQLIEIYNGQLSHWPDGSLVRPIMRQLGDDNTKQQMALSPALAKAIEIAGTRRGLPVAYTDQDAVSKMEAIPGSLGVTTLAQILSENCTLRALTFNGVEPTIENLRAGLYPRELTKHFYLILPAEPSAEAQSFIRFLKSEEGEQILIHNGNMFIP
jgi:phosphate transport system substrate-binding protein